MQEFEIRNKLYLPRKELKAWPGLSIGVNGKPGCISKLNPGSRQYSKVSAIALTLEKLMDKKISVCPVSRQTLTYVEYTTSAGDVKAAIVNVDAANSEFTVVTDAKYDQSVVSMVFSAIFFNPRMKDEILAAGDDISEIVTIMSNFPVISEDDLLVACDAFYYAVGKKYRVKYDVDATTFEASKKRFAQGGLFEKAPLTADPVGITVEDDGQSVSTIQDAIYREPIAEFMNRCKRGEFVIKLDWSDDQLKAILPLTYLDNYKPTEKFRLCLISVWKQLSSIKEKLEDGSMTVDEALMTPVNILVMGKPGTGKSEMARSILCALGYPQGFINCKDNSEEDEFEGMQKFINGRVCSIPTQLARFWSVGGGVLLEEINLPNPGVMQGALGQALEKPHILKVDGYREHKRSPFTVIFGTMNVGTNGTKPLNQALKSRLPETYVLEDAEDEAFKKILLGYGYSKRNCDMAFRAYKAALDYLDTNGNSEFLLSVTMRSCVAFARLLDVGQTLQQAFHDTFFGQIYAEDPEVAFDLEDYVMKII